MTKNTKMETKTVTILRHPVNSTITFFHTDTPKGSLRSLIINYYDEEANSRELTFNFNDQEVSEDNGKNKESIEAICLSILNQMSPQVLDSYEPDNNDQY